MHMLKKKKKVGGKVQFLGINNKDDWLDQSMRKRPCDHVEVLEIESLKTDTKSAKPVEQSSESFLVFITFFSFSKVNFSL